MAFEPSRQAFKDAADEAYSKNPKSEISDGLKLIFATPTLKFWRRGNTVMVGIRGTQDARDLVADARIALGLLQYSSRFKEDLKILNEVQGAYRDDIFYGSGHSLGAAILDLFISRKLIYKGVSYNGALQLGKEETANQRVYASGDALGLLSRPFLYNPAEIRYKPTDIDPTSFPVEYFLNQHGLEGIGAGKSQHRPRRYSMR